MGFNIIPSCCTSADGFKKWCRKNWLLIYTISGVVFGIALGLILNYTWTTTALQRYYWGFPGEVLLINMLKCIIIPLIVFSIITGVASMAATQTKLTGWTMTYYLGTTFLAIVNGIIFSVIIKPGKNENITVPFDPNSRTKTVVDGLLDIIRNCFPRNIIEATIDQAVSSRNAANDGVNISYEGSQNTLGLIMFCSIFGYYLGKLAGKGDANAKQALQLFNGINDAIMKMIDLIMLYHPIGLIFLISKKIMDMGPDAAETWSALGYFILTSLVCLFIHALIVLPLIYWFIVKKNPFVYMKGVLQALVTAFATASSAATMPITIRNSENKNKIDTRVTRFILPLGATINMDGTALYEAIACLFIANLNNVPMHFGNIVTIAVTSTAASIGAAAVPSAGLITLLIVLGSVGLLQYAGDIGLIYTVDWFLDRIRTATNVWGDCVGCAVVSTICADELADNKSSYCNKVINEMEEDE